MHHKECPKRGRDIQPLRIENDSIVSLFEDIYAKSGYEAPNLARAGALWEEAIKQDKSIWMTISGAATPIGLGGIVSQLIERGAVQGIISTGANVYHDLHFAFGLPVWQGSAVCDDAKLREEGVTRIHTVNIRGKETLSAQDMLNIHFLRKIHDEGKLPEKFSTATLLSTLGKEILADDSGLVKQTKGSILLTAAKYDVPIYLDSGANHSLGMDIASLFAEGVDVQTNNALDIIETAAFSKALQPQFNVFAGEGGPRNMLQTTGPTLAEIFYFPFDGSDSSIILSTSDVRNGALSGSSVAEAITWGKYLDANEKNHVAVWGEYSLTLPLLAAYVLAKTKEIQREPKRLYSRREELTKGLLDEATKQRPERDRDYEVLKEEVIRRNQDATHYASESIE